MATNSRQINKLNQFAPTPFSRLKKSKCRPFLDLLSKATWLKSDSNTDVSLDCLRHVTQGLINHLEECDCSLRSTTKIAIANSLILEFTIISDNLIQNLDSIEGEAIREREKAQTETYLSDFYEKKESKFFLNSNDKVNFKNFRFLINPLIKALNFFQTSIEDDEKEFGLSPQIIFKMNVIANLNALFQIFIYYDMESYAFDAVNLALSYIKIYYKFPTGGLLEAQEDVQVTFCNMTKLLINFGCFEAAKTFFKRHFKNFNIEVDSINSYGLSLAYLLNCEISLRCRKGKDIADKLKDFIEGPYIKKNTIKRFVVKLMGLVLASKFPSAFYPFSTNFSEFCEPLQNAVSICKRWKLFKSLYKSDSTVPVSDPLWCKYAVFNVLSEAGETYTHFAINAGILADASFYFKVQCNLYTVSLNIVGLAKMYLLGTSIDVQNGFLVEAKSKITKLRNLLQLKLSSGNFNAELFDCCIASLKCNTDTIVEEFDENGLEKPKSAIGIYRQLVKQYQPRSEQDEIQITDNTSPNLFVSVYREFSKIWDENWLFKSSFFLCLKMVVLQSMIDYYDKKCIENVMEQYNQSIAIMENYTMKVYLPHIKVCCKKISLQISPSMEEQLFHGLVGTVFWFVSNFYISVMMICKMYLEALCFLNKIVDFSAYNFECRIYRCEMFYHHAVVTYKLHKKLSNSNTKLHVLKVSCESFFSQPCSVFVSDEQFETPPRNNISRPSSMPDAPKHSNFSTDSARQYAKDVLEIINKESLEGTRRNVALNFENQSSTQLKPINVTKTDMERSSHKIRNVNLISTSTKKVHSVSNPDSLFKLENDFISSFKRILTLEEMKEEFYFSKLFDFPKFEQEFSLNKYPLENAKTFLHKILCYSGLHPPLRLYHNCQYLHFKIVRAKGLFSDSKSTDKNSSIQTSFVLLYHLSESIDYATYRYRSIIINHKKNSIKKGSPSNLDSAKFDFKDFVYNPYMMDLPNNWRFVQLKILHNDPGKSPDILINRFQNGREPVFIHISCKRQEKVFTSFLDEFEEVMKGNSSSMLELTNRELYWKIRYDNDNRLKLLLLSFENIYLGPFKALMLGQIENPEYQKARLWFKKKLIAEAQDRKYKCADSALLSVFTESVIFLSDIEFECGIKILFKDCDANFISSISKLKTKYFNVWSNSKASLYSTVSPIGLILDKPIVQFPFESLPTLREVHQPCFRVPSLRVAANLYKTFNSSNTKNCGFGTLNHDRAFYLLNPANNLPNTEAFFKTTLQGIPGWQGLIGQEPSYSILKENLEKNDLYLFFGHGSGSSYYKKIPNGFDNLSLKSVSIVIGCSSGRLNSDGKLDGSFGMPYRFLMNGAPCYVGNLWDVTDKDIDIFTDSFFSLWLKPYKPSLTKQSSLSRSLSISRNSCKLKHLIGSAPVVYGLPHN